MMPFILVLFSVIMIVSSFSTLAEGGRVMYDEKTFQDYAKLQYEAEFGDTGDAYEDNLLIVFLTDENATGYYTIAWKGDNVKTEVSDMFGNEYTTYGRAVLDSVAEDYTYSLSSNLARVMEKMTSSVERTGLDSYLYEKYSHELSPESHVTNFSALSVNEATIERSLKEFTETTDIPVVIVIEDMENVFEKGFAFDDIILIIFGLGMLGAAVFIVVQIVKNNKKKDDKKDEEPYNRYAKD